MVCDIVSKPKYKWDWLSAPWHCHKSFLSALIELTSVDWGKLKVGLKNKFSIYFNINICTGIFSHYSDYAFFMWNWFWKLLISYNHIQQKLIWTKLILTNYRAQGSKHILSQICQTLERAKIQTKIPLDKNRNSKAMKTQTSRTIFLENKDFYMKCLPPIK